MKVCKHPLCDRPVNSEMEFCCRLCFEADQGKFPSDEHTSGCELRLVMVRDPAMRVLVAIHERLGRKNPQIWEAWQEAIEDFQGVNVTPERFDAIDLALWKIREGEPVFVLGSSGRIKVDSRSGEVLEGAHLVGVEKVEFESENLEE